MELHNTEALLNSKRADKLMETYAVLLSINGEETLITSPDADKDTYFDIASAGKAVVTTQLVLKAVSENKLNLNDTLDKFFDFVAKEKQNITISHLLTHTSGIIRHPIAKEICARNNDVIAADILSHDLAFEPGSDYAYSCAGMMILGFILEKIYAQTLDELFFVKIKHPLGIDRMRFNIAIDEGNSAISYQREYVGLRRMDDWTVVLLRNGVSGAGGSFWSINAFNTIVKAILQKDGRLYNKELFELAERKHFSYRGLGYAIDYLKDTDLGDLFPEGSFGHLGWTGCAFFINREKNMYAIILSNTRRCLVKKHPETNGYSDGKDQVFIQLRDVFNAIKTDLDNQGEY